MPTTKKRLSFLASIFLLLVACAPAASTPSGSTSPITPTSSQVVATQTLPGKTEMPTVVQSVTVTQAATGIETISAAATAVATATITATTTPTVTASSVATAKVEFLPLEVIIVSRPEKAALNYYNTGWPSVVVMPQRGMIFFAQLCAEKISSGFYTLPNIAGEFVVIDALCPGRAELLFIYPNEDSVLIEGFGDVLAQKNFGQADLAIIRRIYQNPPDGKLLLKLQLP